MLVNLLVGLEVCRKSFARRFQVRFFASPASEKAVHPGMGLEAIESKVFGFGEMTASDCVGVVKWSNALDIDAYRSAVRHGEECEIL